MGLTKASVGRGASDDNEKITRLGDERIVALAGNPNVGKSTVFNALTGMNQHTGNWPGKTVSNARGRAKSKNADYILVDLPGTYSLMAHSAEEEIARNFICFGEPDAVAVVCDATCLERNLNLVLQITEACPRTVVCVNLMDEAKRKGITIDLKELSHRLGVPVIGTVARSKKTLVSLMSALDDACRQDFRAAPLRPVYCDALEAELSELTPVMLDAASGKLDARWLALKLLDPDESLLCELEKHLGTDFRDNRLETALTASRERLAAAGLSGEGFKDSVVSSIVSCAEEVCRGVVKRAKSEYGGFDRRLDRLLTSRLVGYPVMLLLLALIFWITVTGANYPSSLLSDGFGRLQELLSAGLYSLGAPEWVNGVFVLGIYRVLAWVVSVMLPPMAIFFPLFTLLEDAGYLPRVAYNLDRPLKRCSACGKQALTMCMGFGCNAAGVVGCRIIDSPRERLLAILTNNFVPCNGRFPTLIAIISMFFVGSAAGLFSSVTSAAILTLVILLGILATLAATKLLSKTVLRGLPSSFTLELPPYRRPQLGRVIVRSIFDRTLFVLGRAVVVAAPAGLIIWLAANITVGDASILSHCAGFLDGFGRLLGMDGVILIAFILGFPANEIVVPIILMAYLSAGTLTETDSLLQMRELLVSNGWTQLTALNVMLFSLFHWPCSTTVLTIKKETGSIKWTLVSVLLPTVTGILVCMATTFAARLFGLI